MAPSVHRFTAKLGSEGRGTLFVEIPFDVKAVFGKARPPVTVTINRYTWRSTVSVYGGRYYLPVRASNRDPAGVTVGDTVDVRVALDTAPRVVAPPPELAKNAKARAAWNAQSYSHQKEHADWINGAKKPETRAARVKKMLAMLLARK